MGCMKLITAERTLPLFDAAGIRHIETTAAAALPSHTLMQRAGLSVARLAMALVPHARTIWIACGPGNNGGDGLEAAAQLQARGFRPVVTWLGDAWRAPPDTLRSLQNARAAGVRFDELPPETFDLAVDALLGIGASRPPAGRMAEWLARMDEGPAPVLCVDVPSGLEADTGRRTGSFAGSGIALGRAPRHCLTLLALKPGLFTADGRDLAGDVWLDDLGVRHSQAPTAWLSGRPAAHVRVHGSHKGSYGDVVVVGGASGMAGAALLAGSAALHGGAGRVFIAPLDPAATMLDVGLPELMFRTSDALTFDGKTVVCGCGGGEAIRAVLPRVLSTASSLVLDADALNGVAADASLQQLLARRGARACATVLTPHPLEAARLLGCSTAQVQAHRLGAAQALANRFCAVVVLKGSGSVIAAPGRAPHVNPTGDAKLATAGTGDVLAGMIGAALAVGRDAVEATCATVWRHGAIAQAWPVGVPLTAGALAAGCLDPAPRD